MKRKIFTVVLSLVLCICMLPAGVFAAEDGKTGAEGFVPEPYFSQNLWDMYDAGKLTLPAEWTDVKLSKEEKTGGLMIKGPKAQIAEGKIVLAEQFDFAQGAVGRITVTGLGDRKQKVTAEVYLDDETEPAASVSLRNQMGKRGWTVAGDVTQDVLAKNITGKHRVSLRLVDNSSKADTDKISILLKSVEFGQTTLPVLWFDIDESQGSISAMNGDPFHDTECYGSVHLQVPEGFQSEYTDQAQEDVTLDLEYIRGRGNSTWDNDKKPYKVKLDKSTDLFGMGKNKHWVLLANRYDPSFMRNKMTYWLGDQLGMEFTPQSVPVEVMMNGEYYGSYFLTEQIRVGKTRVNIDDLEDGTGPDATEEPEITGGYLLSMGSDEDELSFETKQGMSFYLEHPSFEDYKNETQLNYIKGYMQDTENAIFGKNFKDASGKSYEEYLDIPSAVDYFWIQELSHNGDAYGNGSTYLYKKRDGKLFWGPLWDFDFVAWGDLEYQNYDTEGFLTNGCNWFVHMLSDPAFAQKVRDRWPAIKEQMTEITKEGGLLDQYYEQLKTSARYDTEKWGDFTKTSGFDDFMGMPDVPDIQEELDQAKEDAESRTYKDHVEQLRGWLNQRVAWVDENLEQLEVKEVKLRFLADGKEIDTYSVAADQPIGELPEAPAKKGYLFKGWYIYGDVRLTPQDSISEDLDAEAVYVRVDQTVKVKKVFLSDYKLYCSLFDEDAALTAIVSPEDAINQDVEWSSSDPKVVEVSSDGQLSLLAAGKATITAASKDGPKATCEVVVSDSFDEDHYLSDFSLSPASQKVKKGDRVQFVVNTEPEYVMKSPINWISSDPKIAEVDSYGVVTAKAAGKAQIFAISTDLYEVRTASVTVTDPAAVKAAKARTVKGLKLKVKGKSRKVVVMYRKTKGATAYQIQYKLKGTKKWKNLVKSTKKVKYTTKKLKKDKKYVFRVRPISKVGGQTVYGKWTNIRTVKVKRK